VNRLSYKNKGYINKYYNAIQTMKRRYKLKQNMRTMRRDGQHLLK